MRWMIVNISILICMTANAQSPAGNTKATYTNPIIYADYSDPDAIRVGDDYYMISSSFTHVPGLPILHSKDLVNWELMGHALQTLTPSDHFKEVQHGGGVWAPSIRFHNNQFYIYYPDPDFGIYMIKATQMTGPWSEPILVDAGRGLIDPCPLWDDDGKAYLVHAYAGSRAGFKSIIVVKEMNKEGTKIIGDAVMIYDGHKSDPTIEGPKIYKRNKFYYVFAPAGGVSTGWQTILRSKNIYGPYERKIAMGQGNTSINGPHQGAWVTTQTGQDWFLHFQDLDAYGRVVLLEPMQWKNDWPVIGTDAANTGTGQPVIRYAKPYPASTSSYVIPSSDEFDAPRLGLQWQWQANPKSGWAFPTPGGFLRLNAIQRKDSFNNYWPVPNLLMQKFPAETFSATTKITFHAANTGDRTGLIVFGLDYAFVSLVKKDDGVYVSFNQCIGAEKNKPEKEEVLKKWDSEEIFFKVNVSPGAICKFSYSADGKNFTEIQTTLKAQPGKWVGAKVGLFCTSSVATNDAGFVDVDWFRINK